MPVDVRDSRDNAVSASGGTAAVVKTWGRRRLLLLMGPALAALVLLAWLAYAQGIGVLQKRHVAVPPAPATPRQVVAAFTEALDAHDCATARRLSVDPSSADKWCHDVLALRHVRVQDPVPEPQWAGHQGQQVMNVPVTFDLRWRLFHDDGSMPQGPTLWGYLLVRDSAGHPWRIADQGTG